ncbi:MAG: endonuclease/exonuclease/phosphatase family protein [Myxococcales bacterium]|nr:endonuclease/exonuclease/phosphatase family protein [Myxococcales bacterium]
MARLRLVTLNLWGTQPPLERRLALAIRQLRALDPDVIALQEVRPLPDSPGGAEPRTTAHALAEALGLCARYATAVRWDDGAYPGAVAGEEGLALLTRSPLLATRVLPLPEPRPTEARILLSGQVATAAGPIWVHTTHLHYRLDDGLAREAQVQAIDAELRGLGRGLGDSPQLLCGDFNAEPDSDEIRFLRGAATLGGRRTHFQDAWLRRHREAVRGDGPAQGITWSSENEHTRPLRSLDIDRRIDYVFVTSRKRDGRGTVLDCQVVMTEREGQGADAVCASDHFGVLADVQI